MNFIIRSFRFVYKKGGLNFHQKVQNEQVKKLNILSLKESNEYFKEIIESGKSSFLSRLGTPEANCVLNNYQILAHLNKSRCQKMNSTLQGKKSFWEHSVKEDLENLVGVFPTNDEILVKFSNIYLESLKDVDGIGVWGFVPGENFIIKNNCLGAVKYDPGVLDPYFLDFPWTQYLENKKVLVIHPFAQSIEEQYKKKSLLFANKKILPFFKLTTIKTVQSIAGNKTFFNDWFEALDYMKHEIDEKDFDIALVSGGAYGLPLSAYIKSIGKCAIHMGGSLQILFGIKGKRWDDHPETAKLYNEYWVRPNENEVVKNSEIVEGGCYW